MFSPHVRFGHATGFKEQTKRKLQRNTFHAPRRRGREQCTEQDVPPHLLGHDRLAQTPGSGAFGLAGNLRNVPRQNGAFDQPANKCLFNGDGKILARQKLLHAISMEKAKTRTFFLGLIGA